MRTREFDELQKNSNTNEEEDGEWETRLRLTPEEMAEREAQSQILVERERHRLKMEEMAAAREAEVKVKEEEEKEREKQRKAKKRKLDAEAKRLKESYKELPEDLMRVAEGLIQRAAFMRLTLEEYERDLEENGHVELFSQSDKTEPYERERPVARLYNTMNRNYQQIIKQLADLVPPAPPLPKAPPKPDAFEEILNRGQNNGEGSGSG